MRHHGGAVDINRYNPVESWGCLFRGLPSTKALPPRASLTVSSEDCGDVCKGVRGDRTSVRPETGQSDLESYYNEYDCTSQRTLPVVVAGGVILSTDVILGYGRSLDDDDAGVGEHHVLELGVSAVCTRSKVYGVMLIRLRGDYKLQVPNTRYMPLCLENPDLPKLSRRAYFFISVANNTQERAGDNGSCYPKPYKASLHTFSSPREIRYDGVEKDHSAIKLSATSDSKGPCPKPRSSVCESTGGFLFHLGLDEETLRLVGMFRRKISDRDGTFNPTFCSDNVGNRRQRDTTEINFVVPIFTAEELVDLQQEVEKLEHKVKEESDYTVMAVLIGCSLLIICLSIGIFVVCWCRKLDEYDVVKSLLKKLTIVTPKKNAKRKGKGFSKVSSVPHVIETSLDKAHGSKRGPEMTSAALETETATTESTLQREERSRGATPSRAKDSKLSTGGSRKLESSKTGDKSTHDPSLTAVVV
ncbi:unnamed protein product [Cyprideis torosa]|uniref:Uncharacterized protein n=1 Tax=Cyprideis torosa TaxID=163714 RepID=A0A7R8WHW3_9CRUS|nr:unnamed protein product [Cyprideis torosa]CAG0899899.1 unnamed protein product [Cyprideis torosa]